jgi:hypothetical protein
MPACNNNPHEDEDWSTDDEEGERDFYGNGRTPNHYEKLGQQCLRTGQITSARKDLDPEDWGPVDPAEYEPTEMDHDDHPWSELEDDVPACGFCKVKPCLWTSHKTEVLAYVDQTWEGEEEHLDDIDLTTEQRGNKRKLAYAFASRLINGFLGRGIANDMHGAWRVVSRPRILIRKEKRLDTIRLSLFRDIHRVSFNLVKLYRCDCYE